MYNLITFTIFGIMCTYFLINVITNKGNMTDFEFYLATILLCAVFFYVYSLGNKLEHFSEPKKIREKVVDYVKKKGSVAKQMYKKHKPTVIAIYKDVAKKIHEKFLT